MERINGFTVTANCLDAPVKIEEIRDNSAEMVILFEKPFTFAIWITKDAKEIHIDILNGA